MSGDELEAEALKLSAAEREELVRRLLAHLGDAESADPLFGLGTSPVDCGVVDASTDHRRIVSRDGEESAAEVERAWEEEIRRRLEESRSGAVRAVPASEVFARARARLR